jgi:2-polyprenyl-6-methoxyphenol hydroxylase-like FAD-dependent oxidoreductase
VGKRALIIGGSVGGLFAANLLHDQGWRVDVYERVGEELASRGAGIGTHEELFNVLRRLGIPVDELGIRVAERICLDPSGETVHRIPWGHVMTHWARIYQPLKARLPGARYHRAKNLVSIERAGAELSARFSDGSEATGDLLVGADGLRSAVRALLFPAVEPRYAGYIGWRGIVAEDALPSDLRERFQAAYYFQLPPGEMMLCYPVPGAGERDWNYLWYRPTKSEAELRDLCTDSQGVHHGTAIPPPLVRPDLGQRIKETANRQLAPQIAALVKLSQPYFQAIFDVESPAIGAHGVALLGDAAFVARPHVGMGVTKAALDALCLSNSLEQAGNDIPAALARYDRLRGEFGRRCVARGRRIGAYIEAAAKGIALEQSPERILREVGAALPDIPELALEI